MKRAINLLVAGAFVLALIAPGCYTVVSHPKDERGYTASQRSDCLKCHGDYSEYPYGYYYSPYPDYWWDYDKYGMYYAYPWWWSYYHQDEMAGHGTRFDDRDPHSPPVPPIIIISSPDYIPTNVPIPIIDGGGTGGGTTGKPADNEESRGKTENDDTGKETRQSNVDKPSGPQADDSSSNDGGASTETKPSPPANTKQDRRKGKP